MNICNEYFELEEDINRLIGYLIKNHSMNYEDINAILNDESYEKYGESYYELKKRNEMEIKK